MKKEKAEKKKKKYMNGGLAWLLLFVNLALAVAIYLIKVQPALLEYLSNW